MAEKDEAVLPVKIDTTQAFAELEQLNQGLTAAVSNMLGSTLNEYSNAGAAIEASIEKTALRISGLEVKLADNLTANKDVIKSEIKTLNSNLQILKNAISQVYSGIDTLKIGSKTFTDKNGKDITYATVSSPLLTGSRKSNGKIITRGEGISGKELAYVFDNSPTKNVKNVVQSLQSRGRKLSNTKEFTIAHSKDWQALGSDRAVDDEMSRILDSLQSGMVSTKQAEEAMKRINQEYVNFTGEAATLESLLRSFSNAGTSLDKGSKRDIQSDATRDAQKALRNITRTAKGNILAQERQVLSSSTGGDGMSNKSQAVLELERAIQNAKENKKDIQPQLGIYDEDEEFFDRYLERYGLGDTLLKNSKDTSNNKTRIKDYKERFKQIEENARKKYEEQKKKESEEYHPDKPEGLDVVELGISNLMRFVLTGKLGENEKYYGALSPNSQVILSQLKELSNSILNNNELGKYFNSDLPQEEQIALAENLPDFLQKIQDFLFNFYSVKIESKEWDYNSPIANRVRSQMESISTIMGSLDLDENGQPEFTEAQKNRYKQEIFPFQFGKKVYEGRAYRSILNKQGESYGPTNYPIGIKDWNGLPQYIGGAIPYFPIDSDKKESLGTEEGRLDLLDKFIQGIEENHFRLVENENSYSTEERQQIQERINYLYQYANAVLGTLNEETIAQLGATSNTAFNSIVRTNNGFQIKDSEAISLEDIKNTREYIENKSNSDIDSNFDVLLTWLNNFNGRLENLSSASQMGVTSEDKRDVLVDKIEQLVELINNTPDNSDGWSKEELEGEAIKSFKEAYSTELKGINTPEEVSDKLFEGKEIDLDIPLKEILALKPNKEGLYTKKKLNQLLKRFRKQLEDIDGADADEFGDIEVEEETVALIDSVQKIANIKKAKKEEKEENELFDRLTPYIDQYLNATTRGEKSNITKSIKKDFGSASAEFEAWSNRREELFAKLQEINEQEANKPLFELSGNIISDTNDELYQMITKTYSKNGKEYSGPALNVGGQIGFIGDFERTYEKSNQEIQEIILSRFIDTFSQLTAEQKETIINELDRNKPKTGNAFKNIVASSLGDKYFDFLSDSNSANAIRPIKANIEETPIVSDIQEDIKEEAKILEEDNQIISDHEEVVLEAAQAESSKADMAITLAQALIKEKKAIEEVTDAVDENTDSLENNEEASSKISFKYEPIKFDENTHTYYKQGESGAFDEQIISSTQLRDILLGRASPAYKRDMTVINSAMREAVANNNVLTPASVGMEEKDFKYYTNTIAQGIKGDTFHEAIDLLAKNEVTSLEELQRVNQEAYNKYQEFRQEQLKKLLTLGLDENYLHLNDDIEAYNSAAKQMGMTLSKFSEQRLGLTMQKGDKSYTVGVTPDQIGVISQMINGEEQKIGVQVDNKTGAVKGYETLQLTLQLLAELAAMESPDVNDETKELLKDSGIFRNTKLYIASIKDGMVKFIENLALTDDEVWDAVELAHNVMDGTASPPSKEDIDAKFNRQLKTGSFTGYSDDYDFSPKSTNDSEKEKYNQQKKALDEYIESLRKEYTLRVKLGQLSNKRQTATGVNAENLADEYSVVNNQVLQRSLHNQWLKQNLLEMGLTPEIQQMLDEREQKAYNGLSDTIASDVEQNGLDVRIRERNKNYDEEQKIINNSLEESIKLLKQWYKLDNDIYELELKLAGARENEQADIETQIANKESEQNFVERQFEDQSSVLFSHNLSGDQASQLNEAFRNAQDLSELAHEQAENNASLFISKQHNKNIQDYLKSYKELLKVQRDIRRVELQARNSIGNQREDYERQLEVLKQQRESLQEETNSHDDFNSRDENDNLIYSQEELNNLQEEQNKLDQQHQVNLQGIEAQYNRHRSVLQMLFGTFQQSITRFFDYSAVYMIINEVKKVISDVVKYTADLDAKMVNLQIASGESRENIKTMLVDYNQLASEVGRTTASVADAANDWLRAGYEGKEATELVRGSMYLSTLGMMDATTATSDLISVLKGWKLSTEDVIGVIDKLVKVDMNAAVNSGEIAEAMQMVNYSAQQAGLTLDTLIGILTTNKDVTQRSAQVVGNSWKTIIARIQNVKASKYEPTDMDKAAEDFYEEDWAALNDVEIVLNKIGIKLRKTANSWRDLEDVLNEVATKWDNFDDVTKSAVANAFAGTRQRENFIATIANWDKVQTYSSISENAYGTATQKMEAYTNSIDAAKNSITQAVEKWALAIDGMDVMRDFYNLIGDIVENLDILLATLAGLIIISNFEQIVGLVINGFGDLEARIVEFGNVLQTYSNNIAGSGQTVTQAVVARRISNNQNNVVGLGLNEKQRAGFDIAQRSVLSLSANAAKQMLPSFQRMLQNLDNNIVTGNQYQITNSTQALNALRETGLNSQNLGILGNVLQGRGLEGLQGNTRILSEYYNKLQQGGELTADEINKLNSNFNSLRNGMAGLGTTAPQTRSALQELEVEMQQVANSIKSTMSNLVTALASMGGMYGYGQLGKAIGGTRGQMVGTMLGPILGASSKTMLQSGLNGISALGGIGKTYSALKAGTAGAGAAVGSTLLGAAGIGGIIAGFIIGFRKAIIDGSQEASEKMFKEAEEKLSDMRNTIDDASALDKLSHGVDSLGRNISLTEDEYQQFIEANNTLAEQFPELISYTDKSGNKFIELGNDVDTYTEKIKQLIKEQEALTDSALFEKNIDTGILSRMGFVNKTSLYQQALDNLNEEYEKDNNNILNLQNTLSFLTDLNQLNPNSSGLETVNYLTDFKNKLLDKGIIDENNPIFKQDGIDMVSDLAEKYSITDANGNIIGYDMENYTIDIAFDGDRTKFDKFLTQYETDIDNAIQVNKNKMDKANRELYSYNKAIIRQLGENAPNTLGEILENATDEYNIVLDKIALNFNSAGKSQEEIKKEFANIIETTANIFGDNNDILENGLMNAEDFDTLGNYNDARIALEKLLKEKFGNNVNAWSNEQLEIAIALGFEVDENNAIKALNDSENIFNQINQLAQERGVNLDFSNVSYSQRDAVTNLISSGALDGLSDDKGQAVFNKMLQAEGPTDKSSYGWGQYLDYLTNESQGDLMNEAITNIIGDLDISKVKNLTKDQLDDVGKIIDKELAGLPLSVRGSLKNVINDINSGAKDVADDADLGNILTENLYGSIGLEKIDAYKEQVSATLREVFNDFESFDLDNSGLIDSFSELKKVLDSIESSFKTLREAQEEYNATQELSLGTVLELIATDSSFIDLLDTSGEKIVLKANAEEILAAAQLDATKTSMELALANDEERAATLKAEIKELEKGEAVVEVSEATNEQIEALRQSVTALDSETTSLMKNTWAAVGDAEAKKGNTETAISALKNVTSVADIKTAFTASGAATTVTLTTFESRLARAQKDSEELNKLYGAPKGTQWWETYTNDKGEEQLRFVDRTSDYVSYNADGSIKNYNGGSLGVWQKMIDGLTLDMFKANKYSYDKSGKSGSSSKDKDPFTELDKIKSLLSSLNKEYYQMIVYGEMGLNNLKDNANAMHDMYYESMRSVLEQAIEKSKEALGGMTINDIYQIDDKDTFNKMMGYYEDMQKYQVQLNNLDDEEIQDRIKILELQNADKKVIVEQYRTLVKTADTLEEALEYQKQLYEAMKDEVNTRLQIAEAQEISAKDTLQYYQELEQLAASRIVSSKEAYEYMNNPEASGNSWLDEQKKLLQENSAKWWELQKEIESGILSDEDIAKLKQEQIDVANNSAEIRESMGYGSNSDGTGFIDKTNGTSATDKNRLEYEQAQQKVREQNRTIIENTIKNYESQNVANRLIEEQLYKLLDLTQNDDQKIEILNRISDNLKEQYQVQKNVYELFKNIDEWELDYLNPYLNTQRYNEVTDDIKTQLANAADLAKEEYERLWNKVYQDNIKNNATPEEASRQAYANSDVQSAFNDFIEAYKANGDLIVRIVEDKLNHIQWHIDKLNLEKPDVWDSYSLIDQFASKEISLNQQKLNELKDALKDTSYLTDEQIKNLVDEYNTAYKEIHAIKVKELEDQIDYQDKIYQAATNEINRYIDDLDKQKEAAEDAYDKELEKLKDKEDAITRTNKLIQLQNNLLNANKEKERVYRQGIGWVYESPRDKIRKAQQDLDDFNLQDNIDDLEAAKNKELELLDEAIKGWQLYLEMLAYQYGEYDRLQEQQLLREYFGVKSNEEVQKIITDDMVTFNKNYKNNMENFITDLDILFGKFVSVFETLLEKITGLQFNLWEEQTKVFDLLDINDYLIGNEVQDLADYFRNPPKQQAKLIKKLEADPIYDIILNDAAIEKNSQAAGNKASKYWTTVTNADGEKISRLDLSGLMAEDIKNGNWVAALEHSILRTSAVLTEGHDLNALGWRSNKEVFIDAMKDAGYYQAVIDAFDKIYNEDKVWENANLMNVFSQLEQGNGVASELNQGLITVMAMLGTGNKLSEEQIAQIGEAIAGLNMLSGEYDSTSDIYNQYISSRLAALNADTNETGSFYDALMNLNGIGNNQEMKDYMNLIDAEYQATGGKGSLFMNEHIDYSALLNQALDNNDYLTALRAGIVRDKKIEEKNIDLRANGWDTTKDTLLNALSKNGLSEAQLKTVNQNLNDIDTTYKNASAINNYLQSTGNNYLSQNAGLLSGLALTLPNEIGYDFAQMIGTSISNADLLSNGISYSTNEAGQIIISNASENADAVNATLGELQNSFTSDIQDQISKDATYYDQVIELLKASNATKDEIRAFNNSYVSSGGTFTGSSYGDSGYDGSDSSSSRTWTSTYTRVDSSGNTNTATGSYNGSISASDAIAQAKSDWAAANARNDPQGMAQAHANAEAARASMGYSTDDSGLNPTPLGSHALGIETGPVTYTGLGMLHGTPSSPEYVLNSDQAYNILRYISTNKPQDNIETNNNNNTSTTQYVVEGDIVLEGVNDPAEFWNSVTTAMGTRWNVTKNNRIK